MVTSGSGQNRLEALGHGIFYLVLRAFGQVGGYILLVPVIFAYVLGSRKIHRQTAPYLRRRFPQFGVMRRWLATAKNVMAFGQVLVDRGWLGVGKNGALQGEIIGYDLLLEQIAKGKGAVLLTAHVGNWQTALANLDSLPVPVHALMHYDQETVAKHYFDLGGKKRPVQIICSDGPFGGMLEATAALQRGEVVTIMGDRRVKGGSVAVDFLGDAVRLPEAAYVLAGCVGAPVIVLFAAKKGRQKFELRVWDVWHPQWQGREQRQEEITASGQRFAKNLQDYLTENPYQWFNFYNFWEQELISISEGKDNNSTGKLKWKN